MIRLRAWRRRESEWDFVVDLPVFRAIPDINQAESAPEAIAIPAPVREFLFLRPSRPGGGYAGKRGGAFTRFQSVSKLSASQTDRVTLSSVRLPLVTIFPAMSMSLRRTVFG